MRRQKEQMNGSTDDYPPSQSYGSSSSTSTKRQTLPLPLNQAFTEDGAFQPTRSHPVPRTLAASRSKPNRNNRNIVILSDEDDQLDDDLLSRKSLSQDDDRDDDYNPLKNIPQILQTSAIPWANSSFMDLVYRENLNALLTNETVDLLVQGLLHLPLFQNSISSGRTSKSKGKTKESDQHRLSGLCVVFREAQVRQLDLLSSDPDDSALPLPPAKLAIVRSCHSSAVSKKEYALLNYLPSVQKILEGRVPASADDCKLSLHEIVMNCFARFHRRLTTAEMYFLDGMVMGQLYLSENRELYCKYWENGMVLSVSFTRVLSEVLQHIGSDESLDKPDANLGGDGETLRATSNSSRPPILQTPARPVATISLKTPPRPPIDRSVFRYIKTIKCDSFHSFLDSQPFEWVFVPGGGILAPYRTIFQLRYEEFHTHFPQDPTPLTHKFECNLIPNANSKQLARLQKVKREDDFPICALYFQCRGYFENIFSHCSRCDSRGFNHKIKFDLCKMTMKVEIFAKDLLRIRIYIRDDHVPHPDIPPPAPYLASNMLMRIIYDAATAGMVSLFRQDVRRELASAEEGGVDGVGKSRDSGLHGLQLAAEKQEIRRKFMSLQRVKGVERRLSQDEVEEIIDQEINKLVKYSATYGGGHGQVGSGGKSRPSAKKSRTK